MKRSKPIARSTYRALRSDEPDPPGEPLTYDTSDGRVMRRWKIAPRTYVERVVRDELGALVRSKPLRPSYRVDVDEAARRYEQEGESLPVIARALGCDTGNLSRLLRQRGVTMRTPAEYATPLDPAIVAAKYAEGETVMGIARSLGASDNRVRAVLYELGLKVRRAGRPKGRGRSGGRVSYETEFAAARPLVRARSGGHCEASASPNCSGRAAHVHHRRTRAHGGSNDIANLLDVCAWCHAWIHANPRISFERGWLLRSEAS